MKKWVFRGLAVLAILIACIYGVFRFIHSLSHESTDDAYVAGIIVPVSAEVRGRVVAIYFDDNQYVTAGARLIEIFPEDYSHTLSEKKGAVSRLTAEDRELHASIMARKKALTQAQANLEAARAEENMANKEFKRYDRLFKEEAVSANQYDQVESRSQVAHARREAAAAAVAEAEASVEAVQARLATQEFRIKEADASQSLAQLELKRTMVVAPMSGRIARKNVDPGKYVQPGQPLLSIVRKDTWVIANFKETQIEKMTVGQPVEIEADAYPGVTFKGRIDSLQPGTGAVFSLLPPENATGNFVKVVQRLPVKIVLDSPFDPAHPLWPGLSVIPTVDVSRRTGPKLSQK
ncbi:MAG TPA: HlyD family secretion protein [Syntrophorhabdales bacterium]|nr:HlyD family secretion protein [Syntrophorhabdales bacterium]